MPDFTALLDPELPVLAIVAALFFGTFLSEDAACILAANLVATGRLSFVLAATACFAGIFIGDLALYAAGRLVGETVFETRLIKRLITPDRLVQARAWFGQNMGLTVFSSRFISGLRLPTYLLAGVVRADLRKFSLLLAVAAALWTPALIAAVAWSQESVFAGNAILGLILSFVVLHLLVRYSRWENRRLLVGKLRRIANWEFWPVQIFYFPVVAYIVLLAIRYRSLTVFTAANPGLPAGGFKGESKHDIYRALGSSPAAERVTLAHVLVSGELEPDDRLRSAKRFMEQRGLSFPVVVKPDAGERGRGVAVIRDINQLAAAIRNASGDLIVQEFSDGVEASVFYSRKPDETAGRIFSITEKRFPTVVGDGRSTLKELILTDNRAVCMAASYFRQNQEKLSTVPAKGVVIDLIDIGTHSRGAVFLDGGWLRSAKLEKRIDEICRSLPGFYFGRFDLRSASFDELQSGKFKIIELNGVTSESTNIYDPRYTLMDAYRILFRQWHLAFEIGAANRTRGAAITSLVDLLRLASVRKTTTKPLMSGQAVVGEG